MGHQVDDLTDMRRIFFARLESPNGYISSSTGGAPGDAEHCYLAGAAGHSNDYNLHELAPNVSACMPPDPEGAEIPRENCPILLDLGLDGFHLSGPDPAVAFDIDADGEPNRISWTRAGEDDAFLCLDRNQNGMIDDGTELFGYATPLLNGQQAKIGYVALGELDSLALGGNNDGKVDAADAMFQSLCVWNDFDRNGVSGPGEVRPAAAAGVVALDYGFRVTRRTDSHGNLFRYVSRADLRTGMGQVRNWITYDVIFANAEP